MQTTIQDILKSSIALRQNLLQDGKFLALIESAARHLIKTLRDGGTIYTCGNGGSACDAMHFAEELVALYKRDRPGLRAMHLQDPGAITCWGNDRSFEGVFERPVRTFCGPKDTLVAISTSGKSKNVIQAVRAAKELGTFSLGLLGKSGGELASLCDLALVVPSQETERIQEIHITLIHTFCELIETASRPKTQTMTKGSHKQQILGPRQTGQNQG